MCERYKHQRLLQPQSGYPREMPVIASHQRQVMLQCRRGDQEVHVINEHATLAKHGTLHRESVGHRDGDRQDREAAKEISDFDQRLNWIRSSIGTVADLSI